MTDEIDQKEEITELQSCGRDTGHEDDVEQSKVTNDRTTELERLVTQKEEELARIKDRITGLEKVIADRDDEIEVLKEKEGELGERLKSTGQSLSDAVVRYKNIIVQANREVPEELISGDTVDAVDESLEKAKLLVNKVRQGIEIETMLNRIPSGAPERTASDFTGLSPREKIQQGVSIKR